MKTFCHITLCLLALSLALCGCRKNNVETMEKFDTKYDGIAVRPLNIPDDQLAKRIVSEGKAVSIAEDRITEEVSVPSANVGSMPVSEPGMDTGGNMDQFNTGNDPNSF